MSPFRPMTQFDPSRPALVHYRLNAKTFEWSPEWRASFERYKREAGLGVVSWDGLLLDGWARMKGTYLVLSRLSAWGIGLTTWFAGLSSR